VKIHQSLLSYPANKQREYLIKTLTCQAAVEVKMYPCHF